MNKVMNGYSGWTMERQMAIDVIPILADGVKWLGYLPKQRIFWNLGLFTDWTSKGESFSTFKSQVACRVGWLPVYSTEAKKVLHVGVHYRYGKPVEGEMRVRSRPEANPAPRFIDTGDFQTDQANHMGGEAYYRAGPWLLGSEIYTHRFSSATANDPVFDADEQAEKNVQPVPWIKLLGIRQTWAFILGKFLTDPIWWFLLFWLPSYFTEVDGVDFKKPILQLAVIYTVTTLGSIGGGYLSSYLIRIGWPVFKARKTSMFLFAICVVPIMTARFVDHVWIVVALMSLAAAAHQAWSANIFTTVSDMFPKKAVSSVVGIGGTAGSVGGIFFPLIVGNLLNHYKLLGNITLGYNILFLICGVAYLWAWLLMHWLVLVEPFKIPSGSMIPTLQVGDFILVNKYTYGIRLPVLNNKVIPINEPQRGDVVVFRYPPNPSVDYIKRIVGLPGDKVAYADKSLTVNGQPVPQTRKEDYLDPERKFFTPRFEEAVGDVRHEILVEADVPSAVMHPGDFPYREQCQYNAQGFECVVPAGHYFMMGDNRDNSQDSRYWGFVPDANLVGKAFFIWFNFGDFGRIGSFR